MYIFQAGNRRKNLDASDNLIEVSLTKRMIVLPKNYNADILFLVDMFSSQHVECNLESSSCTSNNLAEVSLRYKVEREFAASISWSRMLKYRSFPRDERGFDEAVDWIDWNLGSRMKYYYYIVLLECLILKI